MNFSVSPARFPSVFLDGKTATKWPATLYVDDTGLVLQVGEAPRIFLTGKILPINPISRGVQFMHLADGGTCELSASPELLNLLKGAGVPIHKESAMAAALNGDWRIVTTALAFLFAVIFAFYIWLLPAGAQFASGLVPEDVQRTLGAAALRQIEEQWLSPSQLSKAQQESIQERFDQLLAEQAAKSTDFRLLIRRSGASPNAFALPGGFVILTDELINLVDGDLDAISGVLAHELGHHNHKHGLRNLMQASALTILGSAVIGDYSAVLAAVPAWLGHLHYSREFELEADIYSRALLCQAGIAPENTAQFFDKARGQTGDLAALIPEYLSSHPPSQQRAAYFRETCPSS